MSASLEDITAASFEATASYAEHLDSIDPLSSYRSRFEIPKGPDGRDVTYLCGNSLGLMPKRARELLIEELDDWRDLGVKGHMESRRPWLSYHELFRETGARLVGAVPGEVVMMNTLTVNLHLLLVSFYRPEGSRIKILMEDDAFPSDTYAIKSHMRSRGIDPDEHLVLLEPREGEMTLRMQDVTDRIGDLGDELALVLLGGVNFRTGQVLDLKSITKAAHDTGALAGFDLAHSVGNVLLQLHDWDVDFACWCSYKYLNAGPGALAGSFIHQRHGDDLSLPRYAGWWGNDPDTRFRMQQIREFVPQQGAEGWQISNPPIFSATPLLASLAIFDEVGMEALVAKSRVLTGYLEFLLREQLPESCRIITPSAPGERGCQLSVLVTDHPRERFEHLASRDVICDFRHPDIIRLAPTPLYNRFQDVHEAAAILGAT